MSRARRIRPTGPLRIALRRVRPAGPLRVALRRVRPAGPLRVELRRGTAPAAALVMFGAGGWLLAVHPEDWGGRWSGLASYLRMSMLVLCALMVAAGAWQAGRERRCRMGELLDSTPRPVWQPLLAAWLAVSLAGTAGLLLAFAGAAVLVGRVATYAGNGWWWTLAVGVLALWSSTALGVLVGRTVPLRVAAPIAGLGTYLGLAVFSYVEETGAGWLSPLDYGAGAERIPPDGIHLLQASWFLALTGTLLALAARLRLATLVCGVLAVAVAVPIGLGPGTTRLRADPGAVVPVCTQTGPPVCVARINGFLLDDVAPPIQSTLHRLAGIPGTPTRAADELTRPEGATDALADGTIWLSLNSQATATGEGLANHDWLRSDVAASVSATCTYRGDRVDQRIYQVTGVAREWLFEGWPAAESDGQPLPEGQSPHETAMARLRALSEAEQRAWFGAYLAAAHRCDESRLIELGEKLW